MKNIVLFIDGTNNKYHTGDDAWRNTNVIKLFLATRALDQATKQVSQYLCGVGSAGVDYPATSYNGHSFCLPTGDWITKEWIEKAAGLTGGLGTFLRIKISSD